MKVKKKEGHEELSDEEENQLDDAFKYLNELRRECRLIATQVEDLIDWAEDEIDNGESVEDIVQCLTRAKKRAQNFSSPRFVGRRQIPQIPMHYLRKYCSLSSPTLSDRGGKDAESMALAATPMSEAAENFTEVDPELVSFREICKGP